MTRATITLTTSFLGLFVFSATQATVMAQSKTEENESIEIVDSVSYVGYKIPGEQKTWIDDATGYEITQWTSKGENNHPYFTTESFIDDKTAIIYSKRTGKRQLYKLDLISGDMVQMTKVGRLRSMDHLPQFGTSWYLDGVKLFSLNTTTFTATEVYDFGTQQFAVGSFSVTCDARWFVFSANKKEPVPGDCGYGPYALYKLNLKDKSLHQITMDMGFNIGHVQANPVDPNLILYCWQWEKFGQPLLVGHAPVRIWWVNIDGTDGGPLAQEYGTQRTHETWTADGKLVSFVSKYRIGSKTGKHFIGLQSLDNKVHQVYYEQVSPGHQNIFKDNRHWIVDQVNDDEQLLALLTRGEDTIAEKKILFRHGSSLVGQGSHPHPRFSPNGKYVLFSTDKSGTAQVYTVRIDLDKR
jgi:oligogalacturonide lyase